MILSFPIYVASVFYPATCLLVNTGLEIFCDNYCIQSLIAAHRPYFMVGNLFKMITK